MNTPIYHSRPWITELDQQAVQYTLESGMLVSGKLCRQFEEECAAYLHQPYATSTTSGKEAIRVALTALHIEAGSEVILPTYVCEEVEQAVLATGATPVFCDTGPNWCITQQNVANVLTSRSKAIIAVHSNGIFCSIPPLQEFGVPIIADGCQTFHPEAAKRADIAVWSFHATKCLTTGAGGLVTTSRPDLWENICAVQKDSLTDMQAALGRTQLARYATMLKLRVKIAHDYLNVIPRDYTAKVKPLLDAMMFFRLPLDCGLPFLEVAERFAQHNIHVRRPVDALLHRKHGQSDSSYPQSVSHFERTLSLPLYPAMSRSEIRRVADVARSILV